MVARLDGDRDAPPPTVFLVDDDPDYRRLLELSLQARQLRVRTFASADEFLQQYDPAVRGVLVVDMRMPWISGIQLQELLAGRGIRLPTIVITAYAEVGMSVQAMKAGAVDYVQKPADPNDLCDVIQQALDTNRTEEPCRDAVAGVQAQIQSLSPVERAVLKRWIDGQDDAEISRELGILPAVVDAHRCQVLQKMDVERVLALVHQIEWTWGNGGCEILQS